MKKKIFVIDDDPVARRLILAILEEEGFEVTASVDFEEALRKVRQAPPDLVLIDVVMPEISGFDACYKLKEMLQPHPPAMIVMTGKLDAIDPIKARRMGADDFVVKTSDMAVLVEAVRKILL
jgi:DNA-binding response OmpR family regulator